MLVLVFHVLRLVGMALSYRITEPENPPNRQSVFMRIETGQNLEELRRRQFDSDPGDLQHIEPDYARERWMEFNSAPWPI